MSKKKLIALALVVIMIATVSFSTLAWFTDTDAAKNDFTIGGAGQGDVDKIFSVDVKENVDGKETAVDGMTFEDILPGDVYKKDAYVTNTGSYDQYIRVTMTISDWELIKDVVTIKMDEEFRDYWHVVSDGVDIDEDCNLYTFIDDSIDENGNLVVVMYLDSKLEYAADGLNTVYIMDEVSVSPEATQKDFIAEGFADGFYIDINAEAVQTRNILAEDEYSEYEWENAVATFAKLETAAQP